MDILEIRYRTYCKKRMRLLEIIENTIFGSYKITGKRNTGATSSKVSSLAHSLAQQQNNGAPEAAISKTKTPQMTRNKGK